MRRGLLFHSLRKKNTPEHSSVTWAMRSSVVAFTISFGSGEFSAGLRGFAKAWGAGTLVAAAGGVELPMALPAYTVEAARKMRSRPHSVPYSVGLGYLRMITLQLARASQ